MFSPFEPYKNKLNKNPSFDKNNNISAEKCLLFDTKHG